MVVKEESSLQKRIRLRQEKEAKEALNAKEKILDDAKEKTRMESIIEPYLENLKEKLDEKKSRGFYVFPDRSAFKKIKESDKFIEKLLQSDPKKYGGRNIAYFSIGIQEPPKKDDILSFKRHGIHILVDVIIKPIDKNGKFTKKEWGTRINWRNQDFKTTKLTFKLLESIMHPLVKLNYYSVNIMGESIISFVKDLEKLGYKFDDVLSPLSGV
jgi:menaquinone-dependent protoporphyrinogen IX oxidase